jgi:hypothetical protein
MTQTVCYFKVDIKDELTVLFSMYSYKNVVMKCVEGVFIFVDKLKLEA